MTTDSAVKPDHLRLRIARIITVAAGVVAVAVSVEGLWRGSVLGMEADLVLLLFMVMGVLMIIDGLSDLRNPYGVRYLYVAVMLVGVAVSYFLV